MSFFIYDYECFGLNPARDGVAQWAGVRVSDELEPIEPAKALYCKPAVDYLPAPESVLLTGITPQYCAEHGLLEPEFIAGILHEFQQPNTCTVGYNNLRFDDEFTRHLAYRNFHDPYAYSYQNGNSRWDLLDVLRAAYALRPDGIAWARQEDGTPSFRLEDLSAANGIEHTQAHDALSDVWATLGLMRLLRKHQPRLWDYALKLRDKNHVLAQLQQHQGKALLHVSGMFGATRSFLSLVVPISPHPYNKNAWIVVDLAGDVAPLLELSVEALQAALFAKKDPQSALPTVPLKLIHANKCPFIAPIATLRASDAERLGMDVDAMLARVKHLPNTADFANKIKALWAGDGLAYRADLPAREQLYAGFFDPHDKALCARIVQAISRDNLLNEKEIFTENLPFHDPRLPELWFEYRARYAFHTLSRREQLRWQQTVHNRLQEQMLPYAESLQQSALRQDLSERQRQLLQQLYDYGAKKGGWS